MNIKNLIDNAEKIKNHNEERTSIILSIPRFEKLGFDNTDVVITKPTLSSMIVAEEKQDRYFLLSESISNIDLGNKKLQKAFGVNNRLALLKKIFTEEELTEMLTQLGKLLTTQTKTKIVTDIKN